MAALLVATGCGSGDEDEGARGGSPTTEAPQPGGRLVVAVPLREPETLLRLMLEPLTTFAADGSVVPYLAKSVEPNETFDRWTITLRPDIAFHNGTPLDAAAVKANLDTYAISPTFRTDPFAPITATTVVDDLTLEVEMSQPWAEFPAALAAEQSEGTGLIAAPETIEAIGPLFLRDPEAAELSGTGPFIIDRAEATDDTWLFKRNEDYWQDGLPYLDQVEVQFIAESTVRQRAIDSGDVDVAITRRAPEGETDYQVLLPPGDAQVLSVALNTRRAPLDDPSVREALALATDVDALASTAGVDPSMIATGPFGPGSPWRDPDAPRVAVDADRATQLIDAYEAENGPIRIELAAQELEIENIAVQQQLADQWTEVGVEVEISVIDPLEQTGTLLVTADFDAVLGNLFGMPDPDLYYFWWHSSARKSETKAIGYNYVGLDDEELDAALDAQRATTDEGERLAALITAQQRIASVRAYLWLWGDRWSAVASDQVRNLDAAPLPDGGARWPMVGPRLNLEGIWLAQ